jgi:divinyl protochlorophyllide a 8-vinyl-reductase
MVGSARDADLTEVGAGGGGGPGAGRPLRVAASLGTGVDPDIHDAAPGLVGAGARVVTVVDPGLNFGRLERVAADATVVTGARVGPSAHDGAGAHVVSGTHGDIGAQAGTVFGRGRRRRVPVEARDDRGAHPSGSIGPNAITRVSQALETRLGPAARDWVFVAAGLRGYLHTPPSAMVPEAHVSALQACLREELIPDVASAVLRDAGELTGDYLLAHRIPRFAQACLRWLPARASAAVLARAIGRHAWTFAGSGGWRCDFGPPMRFSVTDCPLCRRIHADSPQCDYYAATFERVFRALVHARTTVAEVACQAQGDPSCVFELRR